MVANLEEGTVRKIAREELIQTWLEEEQQPFTGWSHISAVGW